MQPVFELNFDIICDVICLSHQKLASGLELKGIGTNVFGNRCYDF